MNDIYMARLKKLEAAVTDAALNVFQFTGAGGFQLQVPDTDPAVYVIIGPFESLPHLLPAQHPEEVKGEFELD